MRIAPLLAAGLFLAGTPAAAQEPQPGSVAYDAAERAYRLSAHGEAEAALREARRAVQAAPRHRDYRELLFYSLAAAGQRDEAEEVGAGIVRDFGPAPAIDLARAGFLLEAQRPADAKLLLEGALAAGALAPPQARDARLLLADAELATGRGAAALAALQPLDELSYETAYRRGQALLAIGQRDAALADYETAFQLTVAPEQRTLLAQTRIRLLVDLGRGEAARALLGSLLARGALAGAAPLDLAYLAQAAGDQRLAFAQFRQAHAAGALHGSALLDAAYNARAIGEESAALAWFRGALAEDRAGRVQLEPQHQLYVTQDVANLADRFGGYLSVSRSPTGTAIGTLPGAADASFAGGEIYWRPPIAGRRLDLFARAFLTLDAEEGATGGETTQAYAGLRLRPWSRYDIALEASYLFPIGDEARTDWLLRAAGSLGDGGDLRLDRPSWSYWSVYGEAGQFLSTGQTIANVEGRWGRAFRLGGIGDWSVLAPMIGARWSYDSSFAEEAALGAGPGLWFRRGIGAGPWRAPAAWLEAVVQYRFGIAGGEQEEGIFVGATLSYRGPR